MEHVFIDTDVIIDFLAGRQPYAKDSAMLFSLIERRKVKGYVSSLCFSNLYYVLRKAGSHEKVIKSLRDLAEWIEIVTVDEAIIKSALASPYRDFEDAIQYHACVATGKISYLITRNIKDYKGASLSVMTPELFLSMK
ncbi:MAG TPA: PIN domain-containing protein [Bacteroidales bacterium]|nr:PIN domain-containing protein [Bacteroidales bacterium]